MSRVLVVGASGVYGSWLVRLCREKLGDTVVEADLRDEARLEKLARRAEAAIVAVPIGAAPGVASRVAIGLGEEGIVVDVSGFKTPVFMALTGRPASFALLHPMCVPPEALTLGDETLIVAYERVATDCPQQAWYARFRAALGGRAVLSSISEHDSVVTTILQAELHAVLLGYAETLVAAQVPIERALEMSTKLSRPVLEAVRRHFSRGQVGIFTATQVAVANEWGLRDYVPKLAKGIEDVAAAAKSDPDGLRARWLAAQEALGFGPREGEKK